MVTSQRPRTGERHVTPLESTRRGAHRARPGAVAAVLPMLAVAAVVLIAVYAMFQIFDTNGSSDDPGQAVVNTTPKASASTPAQPQPSADPQASASQPAGDAGGVDKQAGVIVLNNTTITGLALRTGDKLKASDWKVVKTSNLTPRNQVAQTTVFYADSDQEATAQAIVDQLGFGTISQSQHMASDGITLVLARDADDR